MALKEPKYYIDGIYKKDFLILSKAITLAESSLPAHRDTARQIVDGIVSATGKAVRVGVTGVPGVGKSSFIENLGMIYLSIRFIL